MSRSVDERFDSKVHPEPMSGCHLWVAYTDPLGYGRFSFQGESTYAHRYAYTRTKGKIPDGLEIDHLCSNRACVNPDHLEAVTHAENVYRGERGGKTHCLRGHEFTSENTYTFRNMHGTWSRQCRQCKRIVDRVRKRSSS